MFSFRVIPNSNFAQSSSSSIAKVFCSKLKPMRHRGWPPKIATYVGILVVILPMMMILMIGKAWPIYNSWSCMSSVKVNVRIWPYSGGLIESAVILLLLPSSPGLVVLMIRKVNKGGLYTFGVKAHFKYIYPRLIEEAFVWLMVKIALLFSEQSYYDCSCR